MRIQVIPMPRLRSPLVDPKTKLLDHIGQRGAQILAVRVERYWHNLGYNHAKVWSEKVPAHGQATKSQGERMRYQVRSNLVNAVPPLASAPPEAEHNDAA